MAVGRNNRERVSASRVNRFIPFTTKKMTWQSLTDPAQIDALRQESHTHPVLILKHSTRCSISSTVLSRLERQWKSDEVGTLQPYYLDLIAHRAVSNAVAEQFGIRHESPQVLIIQNGECVYDASHLAISFASIREWVNGFEVV